jgi:hypothetical protein
MRDLMVTVAEHGTTVVISAQVVAELADLCDHLLGADSRCSSASCSAPRPS